LTGPTHVAITVCATIGLAAATKGDVSPNAVGWLAVVIGSLAPDIDGGGYITRPGSLFGKLLPRWIRFILDGLGTLVSNIVRRIFGHRNSIHWPVWGLVFAMFGLNLGYSWLVWFGWGYFWHIMGDFCTKSGVPLFGPIWTKDIKFSPIKTGTWHEALLSLPLWLFILWQGRHFIPPEAWGWVDKFMYSFQNLFL